MAWEHNFRPLTRPVATQLPSLTLAHLEDLSFITLIGDDKKSYLQGQVTCDVVSLDQGQSTLGAHCDAKGKVWSLFRLFHHHDGYALVQHASAIEKELAEIKKYAIFSKVEIAQGHDLVLGVMGSDAQTYIDNLSTERSNVRAIKGGTAVKVSELRWLLILDQSSAEQLIEETGIATTHGELWHLYDIQEAMPSLPSYLQNQHIPQAFNLQALSGISFNKGCYTGQETVARAKYRGTNKRALMIVKGDISQPLDSKVPIELERAVGENWRSAGMLLTHFTYSDNQATGLVILPNDLDSATQLRLKDQPDSRWHIQPLPYSLNDEV